MTPHVHDLLLIKSGSLSSADGVRPVWVSSFLAPNLWVVVRRAIAPAGLVSVGLRGSNRQQRWGGFAESSDEIERVRPSQLSSHMAGRTPMAVPALAALDWLEQQLDKRQLDWGPVGSVGFELATGQQVTTETSDLDLALFAPARLPETPHTRSLESYEGRPGKSGCTCRDSTLWLFLGRIRGRGKGSPRTAAGQL